jgi:outer membrane receptor for ferrienterochelin and colicin
MTTWYPIRNANFGIKGNYKLFHASLSIKHQGTVYRRFSDTGYVDNNNEYGYPIILPSIDLSTTNTVYYRQKKIPQWNSVNTRFVYKITENFTIGFIINNLLNTHQLLVKPYNTPFDYVREGRAFYFDLNMTL